MVCPAFGARADYHFLIDQIGMLYLQNSFNIGNVSPTRASWEAT